MAYKFYYDTSAGDVAPTLIDGVPPVDQSAALATANTRIATLETALAGVKTRAQARVAADAASVDGQADVDAVTGVGL